MPTWKNHMRPASAPFNRILYASVLRRIHMAGSYGFQCFLPGSDQKRIPYATKNHRAHPSCITDISGHIILLLGFLNCLKNCAQQFVCLTAMKLYPHEVLQGLILLHPQHQSLGQFRRLRQQLCKKFLVARRIAFWACTSRS